MDTYSQRLGEVIRDFEMNGFVILREPTNPKDPIIAYRYTKGNILKIAFGSIRAMGGFHPAYIKLNPMEQKMLGIDSTIARKSMVEKFAEMFT